MQRNPGKGIVRMKNQLENLGFSCISSPSPGKCQVLRTQHGHLSDCDGGFMEDTARSDCPYMQPDLALYSS